MKQKIKKFEANIITLNKQKEEIIEKYQVELKSFGAGLGGLSIGTCAGLFCAEICTLSMPLTVISAVFCGICGGLLGYKVCKKIIMNIIGSEFYSYKSKYKKQ